MGDNSTPSDTLPDSVEVDDRPLSKRKGFVEQVKARANVLRGDGWDSFMNKNTETFYNTNQDVIKDYMENTGSTFEEAMKWAVRQDALNYNRFPAALRNKWEKDNNRDALENAGIGRKN